MHGGEPMDPTFDTVRQSPHEASNTKNINAKHEKAYNAANRQHDGEGIPTVVLAVFVVLWVLLMWIIKLTMNFFLYTEISSNK